MIRRGIMGLDQYRESISLLIIYSQHISQNRRSMTMTSIKYSNDFQMEVSYKLLNRFNIGNRVMSNPFFSLQTLESGSKQMVELIKQCSSITFNSQNQLVQPPVKPGFIRHQLPQEAPEEGKGVEHLIEITKKVIFPGTMKWQSPKFFGFFPSSVNVTSVLGDMFAVITHTPGFTYAVGPSHTELENVVVDWSAKALGLPEKFLLKNSGGGIISNSASESIFNTVHVAKFSKLKQLGLRGDNPEILKLVGYFGQGGHISSHRALTLKDIYHRRSVPYVYNPEKLNYDLDNDAFEKIVEEDVKNGLIPFWFGFNYGNTFCAAIDISERAIAICKKYKIWIQVDAAFLGSTWFSQKYRPPPSLLESADSIDINFTKLMLNGTGGSLLFVGDKKIVTESFGASALQFPFYKNVYTGQQDVVDYKDWIVGLARRNNALKLYYFFTHYGLKMLRSAIEDQEEKFTYFRSLVNEHSELFKMHTVEYGVFTFYALDKNGEISDQITKKVIERVKNIKEGFSSPGHFKEVNVIRLQLGAFHTTKNHIKVYFDKIVDATKEERQK